MEQKKLQVRVEARIHIKNPDGSEKEAVLVGYRDATETEVEQHGDSCISGDHGRS
jgi:hypothetical protein